MVLYFIFGLTQEIGEAYIFSRFIYSVLYAETMSYYNI